MSGQQEWEILSEQLTRKLWEVVYQRFSFEPDYYAKEARYVLKEPYDLYNCQAVGPIADADPNWHETIQNIFCKCLNDQESMYVLDWQHTCYYYYPKVKIRKENPTFIPYEKDSEDGYYAYFPDFYPDGDYYLFFSKEFSCGYLTDPWRQHIFVYGEQLRKEIQKKANYLGFALIESSGESKKEN